MLARSAALITLICALSVPLHSEPLAPHGCGASPEQGPSAESGACRPELALQGAESVLAPPDTDIRAGRGPDIHARVLQLIAIYASVGNHEGVEILTAQLRVLGVSPETISEATTWARLHRSPTRHRPAIAFEHRNAPPVEPEWDASQ